MAELNAAKQAEKSARIWLKKSKEHLKEVLEETPKVLERVSTAFTQVEKTMKDWEDAELEVERLVSETNLESQIDFAFNFKKDVLSVIAQAETYYSGLKPQLPNHGDTNSEISSIQSNASSTTRKTKLPTQDLPRFSSKPTEFFPFWEQFEALVDSQDLPIVSKFNYLKGALDGEAARAIKGYSLTEANYPKAIEKLKERFGRKDVIIQSHLQSLLNLDLATKHPPGSTGYLPALWNFYDDVCAHIRSIEGLGIELSKCETFLVPIILFRIPSNITQAWFKLKNSRAREDDLEMLLEFLYNHISMLDNAENFRQTADKEKNKLPNATASALHVNTNSCKYCKKGGHTVVNCYHFKNLCVEDRITKRKELGLCIKCLENHHKFCNAKCSKCLGYHHDLLHRNLAQPVTSHNNKQNTPQVPKQKVTESKVEPTSEDLSGQLSASAASFQPKSENLVCVNPSTVPNSAVTVLQTAKVKVKVGNKVYVATLLFDTGSDKSYISSRFSNKIKPELIGREVISYSVFGENNTSKSFLSKLFSLNIVGINNNINNIEVLEVPNVCKTLFRQKVPLEILEQFGIDFADNYQHDRNLQIDILIGMNYFWEIIQPNNFIKHKGLLAMNSSVGWILSGSFAVHEINSSSNIQLLCVGVSSYEVDRFWTLESFGIGPVLSERKLLSSSHIYNNFSNCIQNIGNRYEVPLVFKKDKSPDLIVNNKSIALKRLEQTYKMLDKDPNLKDQYHNVFLNYEREKMIEDVPKDSDADLPYQPYYLPHKPVIKLNKVTSKIRPVLDGSCKSFNGLSINDLLDEGPSLNPNIVSILLRFRRWLVALLADIRMAFLQVSLHPYFRDLCRFMLKFGDTIRVMRFTRIPFGLSCSPFILNAVIKTHLNCYEESNAKRELSENMFVDDLISGADSLSEASEMYKECNRIIQDAGMVFTKWCSNDKDLNLFMNKDQEVVTSKVLGVAYDVYKDLFYFIGLDPSLIIFCTKRVIFSFIAKFYDPLGFIQPYIMYGKFILQALWKLNLDWDVEAPEAICKEFNCWLDSSKSLTNWQMPRAYFPGIPWHDVNNIEVHGFSDASERGFGAVVYLRIRIANGFQVSFAISRSRVAPTKKLTLPRLELLGALLLARLVHDVKEALHLENKSYSTFYWSDSKVTIAWILSDPFALKTFVCNRVTEIQNLEANNWIHCPGTLNPADLISRGCFADKLINYDYWLNGPSWLYDDVNFKELKHDISLKETKLVSEFSTEVKNTKVICIAAIDSCFQIGKYSNFMFAKKVMAYILRFLKCVKVAAKDKVKFKDIRNPNQFTAVELSEAENRIIFIEQRKIYAPEINSILNRQNLPKGSNLSSLAPILDEEGFLRKGGRIKHADLSYENIHPLIIPSGHLSKILINNHHHFIKHSGLGTTLTTLRAKYWIIKAVHTAKSIFKSCNRCQRHDSRSIQQPSVPLPSFRVSQCPPFTVSGIDHAGPLYCSDQPENKFYILLLTCSVTRAVHIELVDSMSIPDCQLAIRRFAARRGMPSVFYSDNSKTFEGTNKKLQNIFGSFCPIWNFIPPKSPWWGGFWERQIKSIKNCLKKSLHFQKLTRTELETNLHEIEAIINSRPLTYISEDIRDKNPLTPAHFLLNRTYGSKLENVIEDFDVSSQDLQLNYSIRKGCIALFWQTWSEEYLKSLPCVISKAFNKKQVKVGDLVLIRNENKAKIFWPMGIITQTFLSEDGACRAVIVKTKNGLIKRSVNNLHQLECSNARNSNESDLNVPNSSHVQVLNESSDLNIPNSYHVRIGTLNENMDVPNDLNHFSECSNIQDLGEGTVEAGGESEELLQGCQSPEKTSQQESLQGCQGPVKVSQQESLQGYQNPAKSLQKESSEVKYSRRGRKIKAPDKLNL